MNQSRRIAVLVHGSSSSIEAVRARGLTRNYPTDSLCIMYREGSRYSTAREWARRLEEFAPDLIYVINTALPGALLACWWRLRRRVPFVLDTGDAVAAMARAAGTAPLWTLPVMQLVESVTHNVASTIVVRGTEHQAHLNGLHCRSVVIHDGYARPDVSDADVQALRRRLALEHVFTVGVLGSLTYSPRLDICYGWDLLEALARLAIPSIHGVIVGDGNGRAWLEERARRLGVADRVHFCGRVPYQQVPTYIRVFDIALSTQTNNLPGRVRTTGKLPEYMANGRFILASRVGEAARLLPESMLIDYRGAVDSRYPEKLARRIEELWRDPAQLDAGQQLRAVAARHCSYDVLSRKFTALMAQ